MSSTSNYHEMAASLRAAAAETADEVFSPDAFALTLTDDSLWTVNCKGNGYCVRPIACRLKGTVIVGHVEATKLAEIWNRKSPDMTVAVVSVGHLRAQTIEHFNTLAAKYERMSEKEFAAAIEGVA